MGEVGELEPQAQEFERWGHKGDEREIYYVKKKKTDYTKLTYLDRFVSYFP